MRSESPEFGKNMIFREQQNGLLLSRQLQATGIELFSCWIDLEKLGAKIWFQTRKMDWNGLRRKLLSTWIGGKPLTLLWPAYPFTFLLIKGPTRATPLTYQTGTSNPGHYITTKTSILPNADSARYFTKWFFFFHKILLLLLLWLLFFKG